MNAEFSPKDNFVVLSHQVLYRHLSKFFDQISVHSTIFFVLLIFTCLNDPFSKINSNFGD